MKNKNDCPHCGCDLRLPPLTFEQFNELVEALEKVDRSFSMLGLSVNDPRYVALILVGRSLAKFKETEGV